MKLLVKTFNKHNTAEYKQLVADFSLLLDIYYDTDFLEVDALMQNGDFEIYIVIKGENVFIYPYIKLSLADYEFTDYFDLTSPYGYCGPYCNDKDLFYISEKLFIEFAQKNNYVSEFIRYHYLYNQETKFENNIQNIQNRFMLVLDLQNSWNQIWNKEMSGVNRNIVRKLEKEKYEFEISQNTTYLPEFVKMYNATMQNTNAEEFYYFEENFYYDLFEKLKDKIFLARVVKNNVTYCSALFFSCNTILTYYLSARNLDFKNISASNLMLTNVAKLGCEKGLKYLNIGGGRTNSVDDSLFKFKNNFCKNTTQFHIGKRIHLPEIYSQLTNMYIEKNGYEKYFEIKNILQFYRMD